MILPVLGYGHPKLRQKCDAVPANYPELKTLINNMWETLYAANGAGLAAPQIGKSLRLFVVDTVQVYELSNYKERKKFIGDRGIKEVFINPNIKEAAGSVWSEVEGCLSFPYLQLKIERRMSVVIKYLDENFYEKETIFNGSTARAVFHEYDHLENILFSDYADQELIKGKLDKIKKGEVLADYKMKFFKK